MHSVWEIDAAILPDEVVAPWGASLLCYAELAFQFLCFLFLPVISNGLLTGRGQQDKNDALAVSGTHSKAIIKDAWSLTERSL